MKNLLRISLACCLSLALLAGCTRPRAAVLDLDEESTAVVEVSAAKAAAEEDRPFELPTDAAGPLLAKALPPDQSRALLPDPAPVREAFPSPKLSFGPYPPPVPGTALANVAPLPRTPTPQKLVPRFVTDEATFTTREDPPVPQVTRFPTPERDRVASEDATRPVLPPILAVPVPDRAPFDDPTVGESIAAAVAASPPLRLAPAPFARAALPDPFEFRREVQLRQTPPESPMPASAAPRLPR